MMTTTCPTCNSVILKVDPFAKLKSSGVESLTDREIFDMWHAFWGIIKYRSKEEEEERFGYFQQAIVDRPPTQYEARYNLHFYADLSKQELKNVFKPFPKSQRPNAFIFKSNIKSWPLMAEVDNDFVEEPTDSNPKVEDENDPFAKLKSSGVASLRDREIFEMWLVMRGDIRYKTESEKNERFLLFRQNIVDKPKTKYDIPHNLNFYADRSKGELLERFSEYNPATNAFIFKSDIKNWPMRAEWNKLKFAPIDVDGTDSSYNEDVILYDTVTTPTSKPSQKKPSNLDGVKTPTSKPSQKKPSSTGKPPVAESIRSPPVKHVGKRSSNSPIWRV